MNPCLTDERLRCERMKRELAAFLGSHLRRSDDELRRQERSPSPGRDKIRHDQGERFRALCAQAVAGATPFRGRREMSGLRQLLIFVMKKLARLMR
ncbi:MAG TPA: hypothetical protein VJZ71_20280 [Phycisphaerae bacterium]|nr:hypothetical protein [Phycisphaerae bacterium]